MSINQQESDAQGEKEGNEIKVEVGVQTDELLRTCKYGCDLIKDNDTATKFYSYWSSFLGYVHANFQFCCSIHNDSKN